MKRVLTTNPRSGTHYLKHLLSAVLAHPPLERSYNNEDELRVALDSAPPDALIYGHLRYSQFGSVLDTGARHDLRLVVLTRHPIDRQISQSALERARGGRLPDSVSSPQQLTRELMLGLWDNRPWEDNTIVEDFAAVHNYYLRELVTEWLENCSCLMVKFEHLIARPFEVLAECLDYLSIPAGRAAINQALDSINFRTLSDGRHPGEPDPLSHYRCGLPGEWRTVFSEADVEHMRPKYALEFSRAGYDLQYADTASADLCRTPTVATP